MKKGLIIFSTFLTQLINYALADETIKLENLKTHNEPTFFGAVFSLIAQSYHPQTQSHRVLF